MEYCPEIAVLHGAFALADAEGKRQGTDNLMQHQKGQTDTYSFQLIKDALCEIVSGLESKRSSSARRLWNKRLLQILFHRTFSQQSQHGDAGEVTLERFLKENKFKSVCRAISAFHSHFFFDLVREMKWGGLLGEVLSQSDKSASLRCAESCLDYVSAEPSSSVDADLTSTTVNFLVSCCVMEVLHGSNSNGQSESKVSASSKYFQPASGSEHMDDENVAELADILTSFFKMAAEKFLVRESLKDRVKNCEAAEQRETEVKNISGSLLTCAILLGVMSFSSLTVSQLAATLSSFFVSEDDDDDDDDDRSQSDAQQKQLSGNTMNGMTLMSDSSPVTDLQQNLLQSLRRPPCQAACMDCISNILATQPSCQEGDATALKTGSQTFCVSSLDLEFQLLGFKLPMKVVLVLREFCQLIGSLERKDDAEGSVTEGVREKMSGLLRDVEKREEEEERKRQNPSLSEVIERVQKRLPRWKRCLDFGLAKRDLQDWWFSGFLDLLRGNPDILHRESDVNHLLSVLADAVKNAAQPEAGDHIAHLAQLIVSTFGRLPPVIQEKVILSHYVNEDVPWLPLVDNFDQALTVAFNKLSATSTAKDLNAALHLAFHDPVTFTEHAVGVAVASAGQVTLVVKVLQLMPSVCRSIHPQNHPDSTLLCHCIHNRLRSHPLDSTEQKNLISLVSSLLQTYEQESDHPSLLSPVELLSTSVLPFITLSKPTDINPPVNTDFALRLLIGVLDATLSVSFSDWLKEAQPVPLVVCCGEVLDECVELVSDAGDVDFRVKIKSLVLTVLDLLQKHFCVAGILLEESGLRWAQDRCGTFNWTVSAYLADLLVPVSRDEGNQLLRCLSVEFSREAVSNPLPLLRLAAVSDDAERQVLQSVKDLPSLDISEASVLRSLCQLLPHLLVPEVKRVVRVILAIVGISLDVSFRCLFTDSFPITAFRDLYPEVCVSQLLMDAAILTSQIPQLSSSQSNSHYLAQVLVAGIQELLQSTASKQSSSTSSLFLHQQIFCHVCIIMSAVPEVMLESLFVVLLNLLTELSKVKATASAEDMQSVLDVLESGIELLTNMNMRRTLTKQLKGKLWRDEKKHYRQSRT